MAYPTAWWEVLTGLWSWWKRLCDPPAPGTHEAWLEEKRVGALLKKEIDKPPGQRDEERVHQLAVEHSKLMLQNLQADVRRKAMEVSTPECPATCRNCCAASDWVRQRTASSRHAVLDYYQQYVVQLTEQLAADEARRPVEVVVQPVLRLDLPEALQQQPPRLDLCHVCAQHLEQSELAEEKCRVYTASLPEEFQAGAPASAATSRGVAGAATAAAVLPAREGQQAQRQQQQPCGGARDAGSSAGAPVVPTGQAAVLPQRHGSSDQEQEQWDAAGDRCLQLHEAQ